MSGVRNHAIVTSAYFLFTITDGAIRMLVLLHFDGSSLCPRDDRWRVPEPYPRLWHRNGLHVPRRASDMESMGQRRRHPSLRGGSLDVACADGIRCRHRLFVAG
jgi:hypothetical protein